MTWKQKYSNHPNYEEDIRKLKDEIESKNAYIEMLRKERNQLSDRTICYEVQYYHEYYLITRIHQYAKGIKDPWLADYVTAFERKIKDIWSKK